MCVFGLMARRNQIIWTNDFFYYRFYNDVFVVEIVVEKTMGASGDFGDIVNGNLIDTLFGEDLDCPFDNLGPSFVFLSLFRIEKMII